MQTNPEPAATKSVDVNDPGKRNRKKPQADTGRLRRRLQDAENSMLRSHLELFATNHPEGDNNENDSVSVVGPSSFPKPTKMYEQTVTSEMIISTVLEPSYGRHNPMAKQVIFTFAVEYFILDRYMIFLETLGRNCPTFHGDVVLAVSHQDMNKTDIYDYLANRQYHDANYGYNLVVYVLEDYSCFSTRTHERVLDMDGGSHLCHYHHIYGRKEGNKSQHHRSSQPFVDATEPLQDLRPPRTAQTVRYEYYWNWLLQYRQDINDNNRGSSLGSKQKSTDDTWILLIDSRDSMFQSNPFDLLPTKTANEYGDGGGTLLFFGENVDATRIGKSTFNMGWFQAAYGHAIANALSKKPTICSGTTIGRSDAIETYLRAMVNEFDELATTMTPDETGLDQAFHNYLYYSNKLRNAATVSSILVQDQGYGIINNLGALRNVALDVWSTEHYNLSRSVVVEHDKPGNVTKTKRKRNGKKYADDLGIFNWDLQTLSPIVHQYDRYKEFGRYWYKAKVREYKRHYEEWKTNH